jgi:hypothetical protein
MIPVKPEELLILKLVCLGFSLFTTVILLAKLRFKQSMTYLLPGIWTLSTLASLYLFFGKYF